MRYKPYYIFILAIFLMGAAVSVAQAQQDQRYRMASQLMNQQKYQQAFQILSDLSRKYPDTQVIYDRAVECLVNLKQYDKAIEFSRKRINNGHSIRQTSIRLGELYHLNGDTTNAYDTWDRIIQTHSGHLQTYLQIARSMKERNEYQRAIEVYHKAQNKFGNEQLFINELAYTYQLAGKYEKAISQYLKLIRDKPNRVDFVKRSLMHFEDNYLYDIAILEFDNYLSQLSVDHKAYSSIWQLYQWLLLEKNLYERAVAEARNYEEINAGSSYVLYNLGNRLLANQQFALAEKAFRYYLDAPESNIRLQSREKLGDVYLQWADHHSDYNLIYTAKRDTLYKKANRIYSQILTKNPNYQQVGRVLVKQAELSLDHLKDVAAAKSYLKKMQENGQVNEARTAYIDGRIKLFNNDFDRARIALNTSHKKSKIDELSEKTRYYLALTNFYAGEFEYAQLQLKALEKQPSSYYANDAVQLRIWIQDGMQKDSATAELKDFAEAMHLFEHGNLEEGLHKLSALLELSSNHSLQDDAISAVSKYSQTRLVPTAYALIKRFVSSNHNSPLRERLLWDQARIADQFHRDNLQAELTTNISRSDLALTAEEKFFQDFELSFPATAQEVQKLYEKILLEYPNGFYSTYARERIQELKNQQT